MHDIIEQIKDEDILEAENKEVRLVLKKRYDYWLNCLFLGRYSIYVIDKINGKTIGKGFYSFVSAKRYFEKLARKHEMELAE